ncbi:MAG: T9SS type A sorting domain-containing protein [Cyclobacteriaceae bacterium]|nr:T9SS type A sorting domain-containing protein [Cyclobacteriaceae bacterium]
MKNRERIGIWIIKKMCLIFWVVLNGTVFAQVGQIDISRVQQMPNLPSPYLMRDWKEVALAYDELIFSTSSTGQYLPLLHLKSNGINYPALQPILLDTYVGSAEGGNQAEAISIIPAIIGATLIGVDKSNQVGVNWVEKTKDFFNKANGQQVYLNGYLATSGADWWYDLMPNVFFCQLYSQYSQVLDFEAQFTTMADRWLTAVYAMGGSTSPWQTPDMNYSAWYLSSMTPNDTGVIEPEAAGTICWILYHAWLHTGDKKYLSGAQMAMDFLSNLSVNPGYELQLPYGAFIAAKMNAELGTQYDIGKIVNWCFDRGPLRGWGVIAGKWNGSDVSGLIGEANDAGDDYAFAMNGFQQVAALVPLVKYDKRFARDIAKWTLNLANATRLYYSQFLPQMSQDDYAWSSAHDPQSVIAYEALKENIEGKKLYGTGDAKREGWAQTNLGIYGSSHVGYLGAIVESTDVEGILKLDVNKTDFFGQNTFPSFLIYNPYGDTRQVTLSLGLQLYDIYDAITESIIKTGVTGNTIIDAAANEVMLLVYLPQGSIPEARNGKLYVGSDIVDFHYGYNFDGKLRIKSLDVMDTLAAYNQQVPIFSEIENASEPVSYSWFVNGILSLVSTSKAYTFSAPAAEGTYMVLLKITSGLNSAKDSIMLTVVEKIPIPPVVDGFTTDRTWYNEGNEATIVCNANNTNGGPLLYVWSFPSGSLVSQQDSVIHWIAPQNEGLVQIGCEVTNGEGLKASLPLNVLVKKDGVSTTAAFAYFPFDGDVKDYSGNGHDAILEGAQQTTDPRGEVNKAYKFSSGSDIIFVKNEASLNFQDQITVSFWVTLDAIPQESFILSHGSWEERWKVSVTPDRKLRWTVKTATGTRDLDSSFPLQLNQYYHFAVVYSGYSMELYVEGVLDAFIADSGPMAMTTKALTFGRKDTNTTNYFLRGSLDEVRIYDKALSPNEIETLKSLWNITTGVVENIPGGIALYPSPSTGIINIAGINQIKNVEVWDVTGRRIRSTYSYLENESLLQVEVDPSAGMVVIKIETQETVFYRKVWIY